eukprot:CAMPEP_0174841454 /NCGR_PEP_ID=MMETSP1114-20130205/9327_1 /TAXON_ID=312471 /ORGANISM="Neobodo designis, Strain CCAP 1951/1" /LENGTH=207 /DNA_ID=CAMNT_0016075637 /DNA_START=40 /DNA_END=663 /DNA_ORIENTATION=+
MPRDTPPAERGQRLAVYSHSDKRVVLHVRTNAITHLPPAASKDFLLLCPHQGVGDDDPAGACPRGSTCQYVHADLRGAHRTTPHTKRGAVAGFYQTHLPGSRWLVHLPVDGECPPKLAILPSRCVLVTRATPADAQGSLPTACPHFTLRHRCDRGVRCRYVHAVASPPESGIQPGRCLTGGWQNDPYRAVPVLQSPEFDLTEHLPFA